MLENVLYYSVIGLVFITAALLTWLAAQTFGHYWKDYKDTFTESTAASMADMFLFVDPQRLFLLNIGCIVLIPTIAWLLSRDVIITVSSGIGAVFLPWMIYRTMRKRRLKKFQEQLPDAFLMISGSLQAGSSLNMALEGLVKEQPAPLSQEFELLVRQHRIGVDLETALTNMEKRMPSTDFLVATSAIKIAREVGGNLIEVMETLAQTLRRKATMEGKIESLTAQGKLQGKVMTGLPILLALVLMQMEPEAMGKMFTTPPGWATLAVIVVMEFMGYLMIRKITTIDV